MVGLECFFLLFLLGLCLINIFACSDNGRPLYFHLIFVPVYINFVLKLSFICAIEVVY